MENKAKVLIAIPNMGSIHPLLVMRLMEWFTRPSEGVAEMQLFMPANRIPHDSARNFCVLHMLNNTDATHLLFIDSDTIPPHDAIEKLVAADQPIISGLYPSFLYDNETPETPQRKWVAFVYQLVDNGYKLASVKDGKGICKVDRVGAGCLLVKREVFERMEEKPWFKFQYSSHGVMEFGEDIDFCAKAQRMGYDILAHFDVRCRHLKEILL